MLSLIIVGVCLFCFGWIKTLAVYVASIATIVTAVLAAVVGVGLPMLFGWGEEVRQFNAGDMWVTMFVSREGFMLWEALLVPLIAVLDLFRLMVTFVWKVPNPISIVVFGYWLWMMNLVWGIVLGFFIKKSSSTSRELVV